MTVKGRYRAADLKKYEKKYPGRIARKGLRTDTITVDWQPREVVMLRKLPNGEWDVEMDDITGIVEEEVVDDGELDVRGGQAAAKFQRLQQDQRRAWENEDGMSSHNGKDDPNSQNKEDDDDLHPGQPSEESDGDDDMLRRLRKARAPARSQAAAAPAARVSSLAGRVASAPVRPSRRIAPAPLESTNSQASLVAHGDALSEPSSGARGRPSKVDATAGKTADEI